MKLHELKSAEDSRRVRSRVGHGAGLGNGKTSARDQKDRKARSSGNVRPEFEGGQLPLFRRLPEQDFTDISRKEYAIVDLDQLNQFEDDAEVTLALLVETGVVENEKSGIKVLGSDSLDKGLIMKAHKLSAPAIEAIDTKGGAHEVI